MSAQHVFNVIVACTARPQPDGTYQIVLSLSNVPAHKAQAVVDALPIPVRTAMLAVFEGVEVSPTMPMAPTTGRPQ